MHQKREISVPYFYALFAFCLTYLVDVIDIHLEAFKADYRSVDEFFGKSNLENVDYVYFK